MSIKIGRRRKQQPHVHGLFPEHRAGDRWIVLGLVLALPGCAKTCD
jgi:hypothetical protein